jgi:hypothetical protein
VGRRVLVIDDASRGVGSRLVDLGARLVHVYDPSGQRARESAQRAPRGLTVQELPAADFDIRDGAFDVAIVPDLGIVVDPASLLARVRRLLGPDGVAVVCAPNAEARPRMTEQTGAPLRRVDYYELFDLVALQFAHVRMVGLVPFVGVTLADLGLQGEPEVSVDAQLAGDADPPELFVAVAAQHEQRVAGIAEYAIVQLPSSMLTAPRPESREAARERVALAEAQLRASVLSAQLDEANARATAVQDADRVRRALELETSLAARSAQVREVEARAAEVDARAEQLAQESWRQGEELLAERHHRARVEAELSALRARTDGDDARDRAAALEVSLRAADDEIRALRGRLAEADARATRIEDETAALAIALDEARAAAPDPAELGRLVALAGRAADAEARAAAMDGELAIIAEASAGELVQLENVLRERGQALKALEHEVLRRERMVQELVASLEEHVVAAGEEADALGADPAAARELQLARAEIESIRRELEARAAASASAAGQLDQLRADNLALRSKLDALALEVARREGEITSRGWRITELEQVMAQPVVGGQGSAERAVQPAVVGRLQDELDALRQALTQEHAARLRAESGEELARARAEVARQAALIEQLSRELDGQDRVPARESSSPL